jgi:hypothetical protein
MSLVKVKSREFLVFQCRCCFHWFDEQQMCFNLTSSQLETIKSIVGFEVWMKFVFCSFSDLYFCSDPDGRMTIRQRKFLERLEQKQDPAEIIPVDIPEESVADAVEAVKSEAVSTNPIKEYKKSSRITKLDQLMIQNENIPKTQRESNFCTICNKKFSYRFSTTSHIKMVHLKIKVNSLSLVAMEQSNIFIYLGLFM